MKKIVKEYYVSDDGLEFVDESECHAHDLECNLQKFLTDNEIDKKFFDMVCRLYSVDVEWFDDQDEYYYIMELYQTHVKNIATEKWDIDTIKNSSKVINFLVNKVFMCNRFH